MVSDAEHGPEFRPEFRADGTDASRIYQAGHDQHHHHHNSTNHYHLAEKGIPAPDSVRMPLAGPARATLRDRVTARRALRTALTDPDGGGIHVLHGLNGTGKTAVAVHIFEEATAGDGLVGLWVNASNASSLRSGMLAVAADRGADPAEIDAAHTGRRAAADLVWERLAHSPERWLLVLDQADDPSVLAEGRWLRSSPRGTVLVTTTHASSPLWGEATRHPIGMLTPAEAAAVLLELAPSSGTPEEAERLAALLECNPLAVTLVGTQLSEQILETWTLSEYQQHLTDNPAALTDLGAGVLHGTWQLALNALAAEGVPEAAQLMRLLSCLAADPLPAAVLAPAALAATGLLPAHRAEPATRALRNRHLLSVLDIPAAAAAPSVAPTPTSTPSSTRPLRCVSAHGLVLGTVFGGLPDTERPALLDTAAALLRNALDEHRLDPSAQRMLIPHALALLRKAGPREPALALLRILRADARHRGDVVTALALAETAHAVSNTPKDGLSLGRALHDAGRDAAAEPILHSALHDLEAALGPTHPHVFDTLNVLGRVLYALDRPAEDEALQRRALTGREALLGPNHPDTIDARGCLAEAVGRQNRWHEAELMARANTSHAAELPPDHPDLTTARLTHAWTLWGLGRHDLAESTLLEVIASYRRTLPPAHPQILAARNLLVQILHAAGRNAEAADEAVEVLEARRRVLGADHPHTLLVATQLKAIRANAPPSPPA